MFSVYMCHTHPSHQTSIVGGKKYAYYIRIFTVSTFCASVTRPLVETKIDYRN